MALILTLQRISSNLQPVKFLKKCFEITLLSLALANLLGGCSTTTIEDDSPPEAQYAEGERLLKKGRYLEASERFRILKNRHPYSIYAALAALRIGDTYFEEESFIEAASAYKVFLELYPKNPQAPYALFRMGESNYKQVPDSIDRDLDAASSGITAFQRLQKDFPSCEYVGKAQSMERELRSKLSDKEEYVGDFYFKREDYNAAAGRYRYILKEFPEMGKNERTLYRLALSYEKMGDKEKALEALDRLRIEFPNGKFKQDAESLHSKLDKKN